MGHSVLRITIKAAADSNQSPATYSDFIPAGIPICAASNPSNADAHSIDVPV
jgi:hypothetical protein